jgi:ADP-ribose pyrophosphatase
MARIIARSETTLSKWLRVVENTVELEPGQPPERYHCLALADYVAIVARTASGRIPLVAQFRPAVDAEVWDLPAGLLEAGELPEQCCRRELLEEAGVRAVKVRPFGTFFPEVGRLANRIHVFGAETTDPEPGFVPEPGLSVAFVTPDELRARILRGEFLAQLHVGALALAELHGFGLGLFSNGVG